MIERALDLEPNEPAIIDSYGWVLFKLKQFEEAVVQLKRAYALQPDAEIGAHLGEALWAVGQIEDAKAVFQEAFELNPEHPVLLKTLERYELSFPSSKNTLSNKQAPDSRPADEER